MRGHLRSMAKRKVSDFLLREEGMMGNRSAFAAAAFVGTTSLAMTFLFSSSASAAPCPGVNCPQGNWCCSNGAQLFFCSRKDNPEYMCWQRSPNRKPSKDRLYLLLLGLPQKSGSLTGSTKLMTDGGHLSKPISLELTTTVLGHIFWQQEKGIYQRGFSSHRF